MRDLDLTEAADAPRRGSTTHATVGGHAPRPIAKRILVDFESVSGLAREASPMICVAPASPCEHGATSAVATTATRALGVPCGPRDPSPTLSAGPAPFERVPIFLRVQHPVIQHRSA